MNSLKKNSFFVILIFVIFLCGCTYNRYGEQRISDPAAMQQIIPGVSNMNDVRLIIGNPGDVTFSDGNEVWHYYYHEMSGSLVTRLSVYNTTILFDKYGIVKKVASGSGD